MAWLLINSCERATLRLARIPLTGEIQEQVIQGAQRSILSELEAIMSPLEISQLEGIALVYGPGSFSAVRGGVIVANLLSRLYHIPLYGFTKDEAIDLIDLRRQLASGSKESSQYISPLYDAEPNITMTKQKIENRK
jgi:hypothetical protein